MPLDNLALDLAAFNKSIFSLSDPQFHRSGEELDNHLPRSHWLHLAVCQTGQGDAHEDQLTSSVCVCNKAK